MSFKSMKNRRSIPFSILSSTWVINSMANFLSCRMHFVAIVEPAEFAECTDPRRIAEPPIEGVPTGIVGDVPQGANCLLRPSLFFDGSSPVRSASCRDEREGFSGWGKLGGVCYQAHSQ